MHVSSGVDPAASLFTSISEPAPQDMTERIASSTGTSTGCTYFSGI